MSRRRAQTVRQSPRGNILHRSPGIVLAPHEWNRVFLPRPDLQRALFAVLASCSVIDVEVFLLGLGVRDYEVH